MGRARREITNTELSLLNELWQRTSTTVLELTESLYGNTQPALLATVRKLLARLEGKGCVSRDRTHWPHHYSAAVKREDVAGDRVQHAADELYDGALSPLLPFLIRSQKLSARDRTKLRKVLDELDWQNSDKGASKNNFQG
jgi:predicted transcriptional regulator